MDKLTEIQNLPTLENLNRPIISKEIESVIKNLLTKKIPGPDGLNCEFCQTFKKRILMLLKLFQKIEEEGTYPNSFCEAIITLIPKPDKDTTRKLHKFLYEY